MSTMLRMLLCAAVVAGLAGCSLFPKNIEPPEPVFTDTDLPALPPVTASSAATSTGAAASVPAMLHGLEQDLVAAWTAMRSRGTGAQEMPLARDFLLKGVAVVDARCDRYFHSLGLAAQNINYGQRQLSLTSGLVASLQGLTGAAARQIAVTGASLGYISASSAAYGDVYIFSPQVSSVQALVEVAQARVKALIQEALDDGVSRAQAIGMLQNYEKSCEVHTIRRLVNESLTSAQPVASFAGDEFLTQSLSASTKAALAKVLGAPSLSDEQLAGVYWLVVSAPAAAADQAVLLKLLGDLPNLTTAGALDAAKVTAMKPTLRAVLAPLVENPVAAGRLQARLAALRQAVAIAAAHAPAAPAAPGAAPTPAPAPGVVPAPATPPPTASRAFAPPMTVRVPSGPGHLR